MVVKKAGTCMSPYRIFFVYRIHDLNYLHVHGMEMATKKLFTVLLYSPNDAIDLTVQTSHLPAELLSVLEEEKARIDQGYYDLAQWEYNEQLH
ncbi:hypothetical protein QUF84_07060 [Fictibacillus enclensis]|uniref:hypothetical protein n=1 Tax=Fictibacillus enclensis TaxID=1017270 RepID=UPI0025A2A4A7|nr:hypothetical protein [Fictibacillus enclensis]MDM5336973.1 hypothetical protein [Fictibacillus enclensis]